MRDIRPDLKERLAEIDTERDDILRQLERENRRFGTQEISASRMPLFRASEIESKGPSKDDVVNLIKSQLSNHGPMTNKQLTDRAIKAGLFNDYEGAPGRYMHGVLLKMTRDGGVFKEGELYRG